MKKSTTDYELDKVSYFGCNETICILPKFTWTQHISTRKTNITVIFVFMYYHDYYIIKENIFFERDK